MPILRASRTTENLLHFDDETAIQVDIEQWRIGRQRHEGRVGLIRRLDSVRKSGNNPKMDDSNQLTESLAKALRSPAIAPIAGRIRSNCEMLMLLSDGRHERLVVVVGCRVQTDTRSAKTSSLHCTCICTCKRMSNERLY